MSERFISEAIQPAGEILDVSRMANGEPGLPSRFLWGDRKIDVMAVLRTWRQTGRCDHGSPEMYVRKHWYEVVTSGNMIMKIYFDRQPRQGLKGPRWWLFSLREPGNVDGDNDKTPGSA